MRNKKYFNLFFPAFCGLFFLTSCLEEGRNVLINYSGYGVVEKKAGLLLINTPNGYFFYEEWQRNQDEWENNTPVSFYYDLDLDNQASSDYYTVVIKDCIVLETYFPKQKDEDVNIDEVVPLDSLILRSDTLFYPLCFFRATWSEENKFDYDILYSKDELNKNLFHVTVMPMLKEGTGTKYEEDFVIDFYELINREGINSSLRDSLLVDINYISGKNANEAPQYKKLDKTLLLWKSPPKPKE